MHHLPQKIFVGLITLLSLWAIMYIAPAQITQEKEKHTNVNGYNKDNTQGKWNKKSVSWAFTDERISQYDKAVARINRLPEHTQEKFLDRIDSFQERYQDNEVIVAVLEYLKKKIIDENYEYGDHEASLQDTLSSYDDLSIFIDIANEVDFRAYLDDMEEEYTVFVPTNAAFEEALDDLDMSLDELLDNEMMLKNILHTHVVSDLYTSSDIQSLDNGSTIKSEEGTYLELDTVGTLMVDTATITEADIMLPGGVAHIIDEVLLPDMYRTMDDRSKTIADIITNMTEFSVLFNLMSEVDLVAMFDDTDQNVTVFAPTNQAFMSYLEDHDMSLMDLKNQPGILENILRYHVVSGSYDSAALLAVGNGDTLDTLAGGEVTIMHDGSEIMVHSSTVVTADIWANNGIVHGINMVLVP